MEEFTKLKEEGNKYFNSAQFGDAVQCYTKALAVKEIGDNDKSVLLKNRSACFLKLDKNLEAVTDCTAALEICPVDSKALYRRCQALEKLGKHEEAYKDAQTLVRVEPKNTAIQPVLRRLYCIIHDKYDKQMSTDNRVSQMFDVAFNNSTDDAEKRKTAANNLIVLAREPAGAEKIFKSDGVTSLIRLLDTERDKELQLTALRVLCCLCEQHRDRAVAVLDQMTLRKILAYIGLEDEQISNSTTHLLQNIINAATDLENIKKEREKYEAKRRADPASKLRPFPFIYEKIDWSALQLADSWMQPIVQAVSSHKVSACGRDNLMELLIKFVTRKDGVGWSKKFIDSEGIQALLTVAGTIREHKTLSVTDHSRMHVSLCLSKIYEDLISDQERDKFSESTEAYFNDLFRDELMESKLEALMALAALLQGPAKVGNDVLSKEGVLELILAIANSENATHVKYAVEALVCSASKKKKVPTATLR